SSVRKTNVWFRTPTAKVSTRPRNRSGSPVSDVIKRSRISMVAAVAAILLAAAALSGCGYRVRSSVGKLPSEAQSLGIPTFRNLTTYYKIEQLITGAVLKE